MKELIKLTQQTLNDETVNTVNARELHEFLGSRQDFSTWIKARLVKARAKENKDFCIVPQTYGTFNGGHSSRLEYFLSFEIAKHIALMENTDKGFEVRDYFIECEKQQAKALKALSNVTLDLSSNLVVYKDDDFYLSSISIAKELGERHSNNLKVGVGSDPLKRLAQLQTGSDSELYLVYTSFLCSNAFSLERDVHNHFEKYHVRGEWFKVNEREVINYLERQRYVLNSDLDLSFDTKLLEMVKETC